MRMSHIMKPDGMSHMTKPKTYRHRNRIAKKYIYIYYAEFPCDNDSLPKVEHLPGPLIFITKDMWTI